MEKISVENFKGWKGKKEWKIPAQGLHCITGPNGVGKSAFFEAIVFALGGDRAELRIQQWKQIICRFGQPLPNHTQVTLTFRPDGAVLIAHVTRDKGARTFRLNGKVTSLQGVHQFIASRWGLHIKLSFWKISQGKVDTLVHYTPGRLFESLAQVCGTGPLMEMMKEATETLKHVHEQQRLLGLNQSTLAQEVSRVEQHLETIQQWQMLEREKERLNENVKQITLQKTWWKKGQQQRQMEEMQSEMNDLKHQQTIKVQELKDVLSAEQKTQQLYKDGQTIIMEAKQCQQNYQQMQWEVENLTTLLSTKRELLHTCEQNVSCIQQPSQRTSSPETMLHLQHIFIRSIESLDIHVDRQTLLSAVQSSTGNSTTMEGQNELIHELKAQYSSLQKTVHELEGNMFQKETLLRQQQQHTCTATCRASPVDLTLQHIEGRLYHLRDILGLPGTPRNIIEGDYGLLLDNVSLKVDDSTAEWSRIACMLLYSKIRSHICSNTTIAKQLVQFYNEEIRRPGTIWPMDSVQVPSGFDNDEKERIRKKFGTSVQFPHDWIQTRALNSHISQALKKALGRWCLSENDEIGKQLLNQFKVSSVSSSLNFHRPGTLSGGRRDPTGPLLEYFRLTFQKETLRSQQVQQMECQQIRNIKDQIDNWKNSIGSHRASMSELQLQQTQLENIVNEHELVNYHCDRLEQYCRRRNVKFASLKEHVFSWLKDGFLKVPTLDSSFEKTQLIEEVQGIRCQITEMEATILTKTDTAIQCKQTLLKLTIESDQVQSLQHSLTAFDEQQQHLSREHESIKIALELCKQTYQLVEKKMKELCVLGWEPDSHDPQLSILSLNKSLEETQQHLESIYIKEAGMPTRPEESNNTGVLAWKTSQLQQLVQRKESVEQSIIRLQEGLETSHEQLTRVNRLAFDAVSTSFRQLLKKLLPDIIGTLQLQEDADDHWGVSFQLQNMTITQLSGGQKTLLALAFVLALAEYSSSPLYLLDEIDAALDEGNQCLVADVLQQRFGHVQILCISHHPAFHIRAQSQIALDHSEEVP